MNHHPRFGPAGVPPIFRLLKASLSDVPRLLQQEDLDAFEYEAVRWGKKPQIRKEEAEKLGAEAKRNDVWLSLHGSYFINFCGESRVVEDSKRRLMACVHAAEWMGARVVVFHPGVYGRNSSKEALKACAEALEDVVSEMGALGIDSVELGPETMGKVHQLGSLDEVLALCETVGHTRPVIDWSHLHARDRGRFRTVDDYRKVVERVEYRLGTKAAVNMHCHFTKIEFTAKGERRHRTLAETYYGPDFRLFAKIIVELNMKPVVISESPILDVDAMRMREILEEERNRN